jgi:hypothetical protein
MLTRSENHRIQTEFRIRHAHVSRVGTGRPACIAAPSVKVQLAGIRMFFDWLVIGQVIPMNPASAVRGPKHSVKKGKTPVLTAEEVLEFFTVDTVRSAVDLDVDVSAGSSPHVLVVDDEEPMRFVFSKLLTQWGYKVSGARDGIEAIRILERHLGIAAVDNPFGG